MLITLWELGLAIYSLIVLDTKEFGHVFWLVLRHELRELNLGTSFEIKTELQVLG